MTRETIYFSDTYKKNSFGLEDIFDSFTLKSINDFNQFKVKEIFTMILGKCFAIQKTTEVTIFDYETAFLFKTTMDLQIFIHNPGENHSKPLI